MSDDDQIITDDDEDTPTRPARAVADDTVLPFAVESLDVRGRVARLGTVLDTILSGHDYPRPVSLLLAQLVTLTCLLATTLKLQGRFIAQTTSDGPIDMLVVDFEAPDRVRGCARFDEKKLEELEAKGDTSFSSLLGKGHFAMTIDQGGPSRYQGIVVLQGDSFEDIADKYFMQSEQIPTFVRLAIGETMKPGESGGYVSAWRGGGFLVQFLPESPERQRMADLPPGDAPEDWNADDDFEDDDAWVNAKVLSETLEDAELIDPDLSPEQLLYRLFHEEGVKVFDPLPMNEFCRCSRDNISAMLRSFPADERAEMVKDDHIHVICEFCSRQYDFTIQDIADA